MKRIFAVFVVFSLLLTSCASLKMEKPQVSLVEFVPKPMSGLSAEFDLVLKISNPNAVALPLSGMRYEIAIDGNALLKGVSNKLPTIEPYGTETVEVTVSASLLAVPKVLFSMLNSKDTDIPYSFKSTIDLKGMLPSFSIVEKGVLPLQ